MNPGIQQLSQSARQAIAAKNWPAVKQIADQIRALESDNADAWFLLGLAAQAARQIPAAAQAFSKSLVADAQRYDSAIELAALHWQAARHGEAAALLQAYEPLIHQSPKYLFKAAETYTRLGLHGRAWPLYKAANLLQANAPAIEAALASCSTKVGEVELARQLYDKLLVQNPNHQRNHYERARLDTASDDTHIVAMQKSLQETQLPAEQNIFINFALGKEYEDLGRWERAFHHYQAGADAAKQQCTAAGYSVMQDVTLMQSLITHCSRAWLEAVTANQQLERQPIFILGLPRTGTTLVEKIVSAHSRVGSADESFFLEMALKQHSGLRNIQDVTPTVIEAATKCDPAKIAQTYLQSIAYRLQSQPYFVEKYPFNFLYIGFIAAAFPTAKIVLLQRNPMDACFAMYKQPFFKFSYSQEDLVQYYQAYAKLTAHWRSIVPNLIEIQYEALVAQPEEQIRALLSALDLEFEPECLDYHQQESVSASASSVQIREKPHTRSVDKWRNWEQQLTTLSDGLQDL